MNDKVKRIDPIPDEFATYEEAVDFWDTHDTTHYPDAFKPVEAEIEFRGRRFEVEVDEDLMALLKQRAQKLGIPVHHLVSDILRTQLSTAA